MKHLFLIQVGHAHDRESAVLNESVRNHLVESAKKIRSHLGESVPMLFSSNDSLEKQASFFLAAEFHSELNHHEALRSGSIGGHDHLLCVETFARVRNLMGKLTKQKSGAVILVMHPHLIPYYIGWWLMLPLDHTTQLCVDMEPGSLVYLTINKTGDRTLHSCL